MQPANPFQRGGDDDGDRMTATLFEAEAPDDEARLRDERRWFRTVQGELKRQREATVKAARRLK